MNYPHLSPKLHPVMEESDQARKSHILRPRWISYPAANDILTRMQWLYEHPPTHRMPGLLVAADTNNGKTLLAERFKKRYPVVDEFVAVQATLPVVLVSAPTSPDEGRLYNNLLDAFNASYRLKDDPEKKRRQLQTLLKECNTRMIIIDEIHNIITGYTAKQRLMLTAIKQLSNDLRLPIVMMGTAAAKRVIQTDPQNTNRFLPATLPVWKLNDEFRTFLFQYEKTIPLREPSNLSSTELARQLHHLSEGFIGEFARIIGEATAVAIDTGKEKIDLDVLQQLPYYIRPSERVERRPH